MPIHFTISRIATLRCLVCLCLFALAWGGQARAQGSDINVLFTPDTLTAAQGDTVSYTALFTNATATNLYISNATFTSLDPNFFGAGSSSFFNGNGTGSGAFELDANQSLTVNNVVSLSLGSTVPVGTYDLDATFTGRDFSDVGNSAVSDRDLGTGTLHIKVTPAGAPTPEFGSLLSLGGLLVAGGAGWWRQQRRSRSGGTQNLSQ